MNIVFFRTRTKKLRILFVLLCLLFSNAGKVPTVMAQVTSPHPSTASDCSTIYNGNNGWVIDMCATDPAVTTPMQVLVDGVSKGNAVLARIYHKSQSDPGTPQVAVIYSSGYVRLKQNDDPSPSIPFGASFILGPAYWTTTYHHNPQLTRLEIDTTWLPDSPLHMKALGTNDAFNVTYDMVFPPPRDRQARLHVAQTYTATGNVSIPATRLANKEGFKLVQVSTMFINEGGTCSAGSTTYTDCHDSNDIRFIASDFNRRQVAFKDLTPPSFIMSAPGPLGTTWLDVLHKDDQGWQSQTGAGTSGNTPNMRIALDELPTTHTITPQGWIDPTTDPNDDNVTMWLHDDRASSGTWTPGKTDYVSYWLLAQDNPPDPWADLGLRPGLTILDFNGNYNCYLVKHPAATGQVTTANGYVDQSLRLIYDLGSANGNWAQIRCDFDPALDLSAYDHLRFEWRGSPSANPARSISLEIGLVDANNHNHFAQRVYRHAAHHSWWGQFIVPFDFFGPSDDGTPFDPEHVKVKGFFFSVVKAAGDPNNPDDPDDIGGGGTIAIDNLGAFNVAARTVPGSFETVDPNPVAAQAAANWLASQQHHPSGLLRSWELDPVCWSYTYDQALALIVFSKQGMWGQADALAGRLAALQNPDGSWHQRHDCDQLVGPGAIRKWEGDIAWAIYALRRYLDLGGTHPGAAPAIQKGANWLATRVNPTTGCLVIDTTEATIDAWWAFQAAGNKHANNAERIKNCLLTQYWDSSMGRFKGGQNWWQPYLDNQTWGAAFLKAVNEPIKARQALSYARDVLRLPAQGGQLFGFDGQGGPWSVWNEGTSQYAAAGGDSARDLLWEVLAQQRKDGAVPGSPDNFSGGDVWTTRWHGVAPTAWLYNALSGEPFHASPTNTEVYIGGIKQGNYYVAQGNQERVEYDLDSGPVVVTNTKGTKIIAALRDSWRDSSTSTWTSFVQMMGLPKEQLSDSYYFPSYNNVSLSGQLRFGNVDTVGTWVRVVIGGVERGRYYLDPSEQARVEYDLDSGPVVIESETAGVKIIAALRDAWWDGTRWTSFSQMMGLPKEQLSDSYYFPSYNNVSLSGQLRFGNVDTVGTWVRVVIGGVERGRYYLDPSEQQRVEYDLDSGPVVIESETAGVKIIAALRDAWHDGKTWTSFIQMMGLPKEQLADTYYFPSYNNVSLSGQLRFGNVDTVGTWVRVVIGDVERGRYFLDPSEQARVEYALDSGPVVIESETAGVKIIAALRDAWYDGVRWTSFAQMMGLPALSDTYYFPSYNNISLSGQLRFGMP
jgi:hypothetical protein